MDKYISRVVTHMPIKIDMPEAEFEKMALVDSQIDPARIADFEQLPGRSKYAGTLWTKEMDFLLMKYWQIKDQRAVAKMLGIGLRTATARYRKLFLETGNARARC